MRAFGGCAAVAGGGGLSHTARGQHAARVGHGHGIVGAHPVADAEANNFDLRARVIRATDINQIRHETPPFVFPQAVEGLQYMDEVRQNRAGVRHYNRGEAVRAYVVLDEAHRRRVTGRDLIAFCRERLTAYKVPRAVHFMTEWPMR